MAKSNKKITRITADGVLLNKKGEVLLLKRNHYPFIGCWVLPGGHLNYNETLEKAIVREIKEETGLKTKIIELIGVYSAPNRDPRGHVVTAAYFLKLVSGRLRGDRESSQIKFFSLNKLPKKIGFDHHQIINDFKKWSKKY